MRIRFSVTLAAALFSISAAAQYIAVADSQQFRDYGRQLFRQADVPFEFDQLLTPRWNTRLRNKLDAMPWMHTARYEKKPLAGLYVADTLYLPERVKFAGPAIILVNHLVFEGTKPTLTGQVMIFTTCPPEVLGKSLHDTLRAASMAVPAGGGAPPLFDTLVGNLGLNVHSKGTRYARVFPTRPIRIEAHGQSVASTGEAFQQPLIVNGGDKTEGYQRGDRWQAAFPMPTGEIQPSSAPDPKGVQGPPPQ